MAQNLPVLCIRDLTPIPGENEPRVQDIRLAEALEFKAPRQIRELIKRNLDELERYGTLSCHTTTPVGGGPLTTEYWLTEEQATLICMRSDAPRAPEIRSEIVTVFKAWRHGQLVPRSATPVTIEAMDELFDRKLTPVRQEIAEIRGNVTFLARRIDDIVPRRDFPKDVTRQWRNVLVRRYSGECPCCRENKIVDRDFNPLPGMTYDHFRGRELNGAEDGWPVCTRCNLKLRDAEFKNASRKHFEVFQDYRRTLWAGHPLKLKGPDERQGRLF